MNKKIVLRRVNQSRVVSPYLGNRVNQGIAAGIGSFALMALSAYKGYHSRSLEPSISSIAKVCGGVASILGLAWALTPAAKKSPKGAVIEMKENIYPVVTVMAKRMAEEGFDEVAEKDKVKESTSSFRKEESDKSYVGNDDDFAPEYSL